jgi:ferredoxin
MADKSMKYSDNAAGRFYVDETCIDCDACRQTAPDNFDRNEDGGYSFVSKQPENEVEVEACIDAMDGCPTESIGDDGED